MAQADPTILALNSGSSSLKFAVYARGDLGEKLLLKGSADGIGRPDGTLSVQSADGTKLEKQDHVAESQGEALAKLAEVLGKHTHGPPAIVGHRIVHGGPKLRTHQPITPEVLRQLQEAVHFAPLHIPAAVELVKQAQKTFPDAQQFACFDTVFHANMPETASHLPLPARYWKAGVRKYGFHGLSYESAVYRLQPDVPRRLILAHLGSGSSVAAVLDGKSVDTSMGLTPTGGVVMGTRTGDLDPGVLLYILRTEGLDADALEKLLNKDSGLAGLSGGESDMQELLRREAAGDSAAALAVSVYCADVKKTIGGYAALLGGADLLVFTGGIGEHSQAVRTRILRGLDALGIGESKVRVMEAQEELQIARHCREYLATRGAD